MRTSGDQPALRHFGDPASDREPGADVPFSCPVGTVVLDVDAIRLLDAAEVDEVVDAAEASRLQRCPGWPVRRRECPA